MPAARRLYVCVAAQDLRYEPEADRYQIVGGSRYVFEYRFNTPLDAQAYYMDYVMPVDPGVRWAVMVYDMAALHAWAERNGTGATLFPWQLLWIKEVV